MKQIVLFLLFWISFFFTLFVVKAIVVLLITSAYQHPMTGFTSVVVWCGTIVISIVSATIVTATADDLWG